MAWTSGETSVFANKSISADEVLAAGDGIQTVFTGLQLGSPPVFIDSLEIKYTIGAVEYTGTSDSSGNITGTGISSASVTEAGVVDLTFSTAPDNLTDIIADEYKAKGVLQKLREFVLGSQYEETIGTGDGIETTFGTTLAHTGIALGQCRVRFRIDAVEYEVWDDGEGGFIHSLVVSASSSINYSTGAIQVVFADPVDDGYAVKALYCTGAAGQDWIELHEDTTRKPDGTEAFPGLDLRETILKNSAPSYKEFVAVGVREYQYVPGSIWNWNLNLYDKWDPIYEGQTNPWNGNSSFHGIADYDSGTHNYIYHLSVPMKDDQIKYWFVSSKRRIIVVARVTNTIYVSAYLGGGRRLSSPSDYRMPVCIVGCSMGNMNFANTGVKSLVFYQNGYCWAIDDDGLHFTVANYNTIVPGQSNFANFGTLKKAKSGEVFLSPSYLVRNPNSGFANVRTLFEFDGVFNAPCNELSVEDIIQSGGVDHLVIQDVYRTDYLHYAAVKLE